MEQERIDAINSVVSNSPSVEYSKAMNLAVKILAVDMQKVCKDCRFFAVYELPTACAGIGSCALKQKFPTVHPTDSCEKFELKKTI